MSSSRTDTDVDRIADQYLDDLVVHDPFIATYVGIPGHDDRLPAYDPEWYAHGSQLRRATLAKLANAEPVDDNDRVTIAALRDDLEILEELRELGDEESNVRN